MKNLILITLVYLLMNLSMLPLRNTIFDDDFAYIQTTNHLYQTGELKISDWSSATMVFQPYFGSAAYKVFGYEISNLHLANVMLFYFSLISFYLLLIRIKINANKAILFTLFFLGIPWIFQYLYTFMSDTFYISLLIISLYFYIRGIQDKNNKSLFLGSTFVALSFLTRQIAITVIFSLLVTVIYKFYLDKKIEPKIYLSMFVPTAIILTIYYFWLNKVGLTAYQYLTIGPGYKEQLINIIFPFSLQKIGGVNSYYIEMFIQRFSGYLFVVTASLFPFFLLFKLEIKKLFKFFFKNKKLILFSIILLIFILKVDILYKNKFTSSYPNSLIFSSYNYLVDWDTSWPIIFLVFTPIIFIVLIIILKKLLIFFTSKNRKPNKKLKNIFPVIFVIVDIYLLLRAIRVNYPYVFNSPNYSGYLSILTDKKLFLDFFKGMWFFFLLFTTVGGILIHVLLTRRLNKINKKYLPIFFLILVAIGHFTLVLVFAYYFWQEYIIQITPFIVIGIAYLFRNIKLANKRSFIIIILLLFFTLHITRNRYQDTGVKWQLSKELVEKYNIHPLKIAQPSWAWEPWWYFESSFQESVKKAGGNKYKVKNMQAWDRKAPSGSMYEAVYLPATGDIPKNTVIVSDPFWTFFTIKRIGYIKVD